MQFFLDTADVAEIKSLVDTGLVDGVTTNPSLMAKTQKKVLTVLEDICRLVPGPVSAEVTAQDTGTMLEEAKVLKKIAENIVIKVPLTPAGLKACKVLSEEDTDVNVTLCFTPVQALMAAKVGARFISPFVGRLDDTSQEGMALIKTIGEIFQEFPYYDTEVLVASVRSPYHVLQAAKCGAEAVTMPPAVFRHLYHHPLTEKGVQLFMEDWKKTGQSLL